MKNNHILNSVSCKLPATDGNFILPDNGWFHLAPIGNFVGVMGEGDDAVSVIQVVNADALKAICKVFADERNKPDFTGLLLDFDHQSEDCKNTEAAGWIDDLQVRDDGLWGQIRLSDVGNAALKGGRYRKVSPVWDCRAANNKSLDKLTNGDRVVPSQLLRVALTNRPNLKGLKPLSNSEINPAQAANNEGKNNMEEIAKKLGLAPDASAADILAAIAKLQSDLADAQKSADENDDTIVNSEIDALGITDETERKIIFPMIKNAEDRKAAAAVLKNRVKPVAPPTRITNAVAKTPEIKTNGKSRIVNREQAQNALVNSIRGDRGCSFEDAWELAKAEKPELFTEESGE